MSLLFVFLITFLLCYFVNKYYKVFVCGIQIPGPWAMPLLGNIQMIGKLEPESIFLTITELRVKYYRTFRLWLGPSLWVYLHSPRETRDALNDPTLIKAEPFQLLSPLIGNGLLISHGKLWKTHRRVLGRAFLPQVLQNCSDTIARHGRVLVERLRSQKGMLVEVGDYLFPCVLDVIMETMMGKDLQTQNDTRNPYIHALHRISELLFQRMVNPLLSFDFIYQKTKMHARLQESLQVIHQLVDHVIAERAEFLRTPIHETGNVGNNEKEAQSFVLDALLTAEIEGKPLTLQEIRDEINTFVFAGVDTTANALSFVIYALAKYPAEQEKVLQEILGMDNNFDLNKLEYLDMFIKECLRYYTIVPMTGRQTTQDTRIGDFHYSAGITLWINMYGLAHDGDLFESPYEFRPERFSREVQNQLPPFSYIPFSGGPHVCIGRKFASMIMKILTIQILQDFQVSLKDPQEELVLMNQMVLKSKFGINVIFKKRH